MTSWFIYFLYVPCPAVLTTCLLVSVFSQLNIMIPISTVASQTAAKTSVDQDQLASLDLKGLQIRVCN